MVYAGISILKLTDWDLVNECRYLRQLPIIHRALESKQNIKIPGELLFNSRHYLFFLNKHTYTLRRYKNIVAELNKRSINVKDYSSAWKVYAGKEDVDYWPSFKDADSSIAYLSTKIVSRNTPMKFYGKEITVLEAVKKLTDF